MKMETFKDILHWTAAFHQQLSACLEQGSSASVNERVRLLLQYLAEHETKLSKVVKAFEETGNSNVLNTWYLEYLDRLPIVQQQYSAEAFAQASPEEIMNVIIDQHQQLLELYRYLFSRADTPAAKETLESLLSLEQHEVMLMSQGANRLSDI